MDGAAPIPVQRAITSFLAIQQITGMGWNPATKACVVDTDGSKMRWGHDESFCVTRSRSGDGGFYVTNRERRLNVNELVRLQAYDPKRVVEGSISTRQLKLAVGNSMTASVIKHILLRALPSAGLAFKDSLWCLWESKADALATLKKMF